MTYPGPIPRSGLRHHRINAVFTDRGALRDWLARHRRWNGEVRVNGRLRTGPISPFASSPRLRWREVPDPADLEEPRTVTRHADAVDRRHHGYFEWRTPFDLRDPDKAGAMYFEPGSVRFYVIGCGCRWTVCPTVPPVP